MVSRNKKDRSMIERGWSVAIKRKDGTEFLASGGNGILPTVFHKRNRKSAVVMKKGLKGHGFDCRVVPVSYTIPYCAEEDR
jgi:hypothetical protein